MKCVLCNKFKPVEEFKEGESICMECSQKVDNVVERAFQNMVGTKTIDLLNAKFKFEVTGIKVENVEQEKRKKKK